MSSMIQRMLAPHSVHQCQIGQTFPGLNDKPPVSET